jgi:hypothetical protein
VPNQQGTLIATTPAAAPGAAAAGADSSLPDASSVARLWLAIWLVVAVAIVLVWNGIGSTQSPFDPSENETANFALFAGFYVGAQVIERLLELVSPLIPKALPGWTMPAGVVGDAAQAAQVKADRSKVTLGVAAAAGTAVSCGFGLYFLHAVGIDCSRTIDTFATGITIAAGTKPLHDFISGLQNQNTPKTGTGVNV